MREILLGIFSLALYGCDNIGFSSYSLADITSLHKEIRKDGKTVVPNYVLDYDYNSRYIVASRLVSEVYSCKTHDFEKIYRQLEYWVVDKNSNKIYKTRSKGKFIRFVQKNKIKVDISDDFSSYFERNGRVLDTRETGGCKKIELGDKFVFQAQQL